MPRNDQVDLGALMAYMLAPGFSFPEPGSGRFPKPLPARMQGVGPLLPPGQESWRDPELQREIMDDLDRRTAKLRQKYGGKPNQMDDVRAERLDKTRMPKTAAELEALEQRLAKIRARGEELKAQMQKMLDESMQRKRSGEAVARLKAKMDQLEEAKAALRAQSNPPPQTPVSAMDDPFGAASRAAGAEPPSFNWRRLGSQMRGPAIGIGQGLIGGMILDYLMRYAQSQGGTPFQRRYGGAGKAST